MEYQILSYDNIDDLEITTNETLKKGWELHGDLCVTNTTCKADADPSIHYTQAIKRRDHNRDMYFAAKIFLAMRSVSNPQTQTINDFINNSLTGDCKDFLEEIDTKRE